MNAAPNRFILFAEIQSETGFSRVHVWRLCREGKFPLPRKIGKHRNAWLASDFETWKQAQPLAQYKPVGSNGR